MALCLIAQSTHTWWLWWFPVFPVANLPYKSFVIPPIKRHCAIHQSVEQHPKSPAVNLARKKKTYELISMRLFTMSKRVYGSIKKSSVHLNLVWLPVNFACWYKPPANNSKGCLVLSSESVTLHALWPWFKYIAYFVCLRATATHQKNSAD